MSAEEITVYPEDVELFRYMLENAEIESSESWAEKKVTILLENGLSIKFNEDGMLESFEVSE